VEKQGGMVFGLWETVTALIELNILLLLSDFNEKKKIASTDFLNIIKLLKKKNKTLWQLSIILDCKFSPCF
jgi:RNAse (barnase) inhibitor barstar